MAVGLVLPCVVTGGGAPCDTALVLFLSAWLPPPPRLAIKERKGRQEIIQGAESDLHSATLPLIAVQSVTTDGIALNCVHWPVPARGG